MIWAYVYIASMLNVRLQCDGNSFSSTVLYIILLFLCVVRSFNAGKQRLSSGEEEEEEEEIPEYLRLHQLIVEEIGKICRKVNQVNAFVLLCKLSFHLGAMGHSRLAQCIVC